MEQPKTTQASELGTRPPRPLGIFIISLLVALSGILLLISFTPLTVIIGIASLAMGFGLYKGIWWSRIGTMVLMAVTILLNFYQEELTRQMIVGIVVQTVTRGVVIVYLAQRGIKDYFINGEKK